MPIHDSLIYRDGDDLVQNCFDDILEGTIETRVYSSEKYSKRLVNTYALPVGILFGFKSPTLI